MFTLQDLAIERRIIRFHKGTAIVRVFKRLAAGLSLRADVVSVDNLVFDDIPLKNPHFELVRRLYINPIESSIRMSLDKEIPRIKMTDTSDDVEEVVDLKTCFILKPNTPITIRCSYEVELRPHELSEQSADSSTFISAEGPIKIQSRMLMHLLPIDNLTPNFVRGWNDIPIEVKLLILEHSSRESQVVDSSQAPNAGGDGWTSSQLRRHLKMGPAIALLAKDAFYKANVFKLNLLRFNTFWYPKNQIYIRRLDIKVSMCPDRLLDLYDLASGTYGFTNLKYVDIQFQWDYFIVVADDHDGLDDLLEFLRGQFSEEIWRFNCKGVVSVETLSDLGNFDITVVDEITDIAKSIVQFRDN
ncbi:hypothetical protein N0V90_000042 [Kalmusia sp. IMI 367209]|nr:hypothetical protein N0V90_000042 [Kalmusia sp. IMI 367209]